MPIIQSPKVVQNAVDEFLAPLFKNKPQRKHLANYLTGMMQYFRNTPKDNACPTRLGEQRR